MEFALGHVIKSNKNKEIGFKLDDFLINRM